MESTPLPSSLVVGDHIQVTTTGVFGFITDIREIDGTEYFQIDGEWCYQGHLGKSIKYRKDLLAYSPPPSSILSRAAIVRQGRDYGGEELPTAMTNEPFSHPMSEDAFQECLMLRNRRLAIKRAKIRNAMGQ